MWIMRDKSLIGSSEFTILDAGSVGNPLPGESGRGGLVKAG